MGTYVVLGNFTDQGLENVQDTLDRADTTAEIIGNVGGTVNDVYWTVGPYDVVIIAEAPDDEAITAAALGISSRGNLRTTTLRAFGREEMAGILDQVT